MLATLHLLATFIATLLKPRRRREVENLFLRHQLNIALRRAPHRPRLRGSDRALIALMTWLWPACSVCPASFGLTRSCGGIGRGFGPIGAGDRAVSQGGLEFPRATRAHPTNEQRESLVGRAPHPWRAAQARLQSRRVDVSRYMIRRRRPPSQSWQTFLRNHADAIAGIDLCVVPTLTFECLFVFLVVGMVDDSSSGLR